MPHGMAARCRIALGVALIGAVLMPAAQRSGDQARPTWKAGYPSKFWEGTTASERAAIMATLGEIERILWKVPELAQPKGFEILKTAHGGGPPWHPERCPTGFEDAKSILQSELRLWFFAPSMATPEEFLRWWIYHAEGSDYGGNERSARRSLEQTTYDRWLEETPARKKDRDEAIASAAQAQGRAAAEELRKTLEQTEREVTERLKAEDAEERKRNQEVLAAPSQGDQAVVI